MEKSRRGSLYSFELGVVAYGRLCGALEAEPTLTRKLGVRLCPSCGDLHATDELCWRLCEIRAEVA